MKNYGSHQYWDDRYRNAGPDASFDWLERYSTLKNLLDQYMPSKDIRILMLGCGNALLSENLYDEGYHNIINVDISPVCIEQMI